MSIAEKYLELSEKFQTGVPEMDSEHQQLVDLINRMYTIFQKRGEDSEILAVLNDLLKYDANHFASEERYMEQHHTPDLEEHKRIHADLINQAVDIKQKLETGQAGVSMETFKFLQNWLMGHIAGVDVKDYGAINSDLTAVQSYTGSEEFPVDWYFENSVMIAPEASFCVFADVKGVATHIRKTEQFPFPVNKNDNLIDNPTLSKTITAKAWRDHQPHKENGDPKLFGIPYYSIANPIIWNGEFQGVMTVVMPVSHAKELTDGVSSLNDQVGVLDTLSRDLAEAGTSFAQNVDSIASAVNHLNENAKALVEINNLVGEVAAQTNLLGLNAAIEAARAGELGRGFGVVADEIRRLSQTVKDSSKQVRDKVTEITTEISHIQTSVQESMAASEEQAAQLEELSATVTHVKTTTDMLSKIK